MPLLELLFGAIALLIVLFVPGYCLTLGFFPRKTEIDGIERVTFSLVFSVIFLPLLVLIENQLLSIPINFASSLGTVLLIIIVGLLLWAVRTQRLSVSPRLSSFLRGVKREESVNLLFWK